MIRIDVILGIIALCALLYFKGREKTSIKIKNSEAQQTTEEGDNSKKIRTHITINSKYYILLFVGLVALFGFWLTPNTFFTLEYLEENWVMLGAFCIVIFVAILYINRNWFADKNGNEIFDCITPLLILALLLGSLYALEGYVPVWTWATKDQRIFYVFIAFFLAATFPYKGKIALYAKIVMMFIAVILSTSFYKANKENIDEHIAKIGSTAASPKNTSEKGTQKLTAYVGKYISVQIPSGRKFNFTCPDGTIMHVLEENKTSKEVDCDQQGSLSFSENHGVITLSFKAKNEPTHPVVTIL